MVFNFNSLSSLFFFCNGIVSKLWKKAFMIITLRPYHILCRIGYNGYGYSPDFINEMTRTINLLKSSRTKTIVAKPGLDNICKSCPHADLECNPEQLGWRGKKLNDLDKRTLKTLRLKPGHRYTLPEIDKRIADLSEEKFDDLCRHCEWRVLGTCKPAFLDLKQRLNS